MLGGTGGFCRASLYTTGGGVGETLWRGGVVRGARGVVDVEGECGHYCRDQDVGGRDKVHFNALLPDTTGANSEIEIATTNTSSQRPFTIQCVPTTTDRVLRGTDHIHPCIRTQPLSPSTSIANLNSSSPRFHRQKLQYLSPR